MGDSKALKKLKSERPKPEWVFKVFTKPPGLKVIHGGDVHVLSEAEMRTLMHGWWRKEWKLGERRYISVEHRVDLARYKWLPKYMYKRFVKAVCEALGIVYRPYMVEYLTPPKMRKAKIVFPEKMPWDKALKRSEELKEKVEYYKEFYEALDEFFKKVKKIERK